ncbi:MAG: tetratricopeptide repeat protein [Isosphaeraceae bacterium]|nr:tetratricopeptide repeat protein [Isosphaeraceae bacterium]
MRDLAAPDEAVRLHAFETPQAQGRYVEPVLRRMLATTKDETVKAPCNRLLLTFASQVHVKCQGCHFEAGPRDMGFLRDWYAGRKFATYTLQAGRLDAAIAKHEATLAYRPSDTAARLLLAYLYEAQGRSDRAADLWAPLGALAPDAVAARAPASGTGGH